MDIIFALLLGEGAIGWHRKSHCLNQTYVEHICVLSELTNRLYLNSILHFSEFHLNLWPYCISCAMHKLWMNDVLFVWYHLRLYWFVSFVAYYLHYIFLSLSCVAQGDRVNFWRYIGKNHFTYTMEPGYQKEFIMERHWSANDPSFGWQEFCSNIFMMVNALKTNT